ncbi:MAG: bile acid:sodium symporter family protein [Kiritimatiellae bacterium]|nr:bile acid:sodium symporter family protein [Kiritimatiellia bacterium]
MKILQLVSAFLAKWTPLFVTLVAVLTFFCPVLFDWVRGTTQTVILGIIMLAMGMTLKAEDFRILILRPFDIVIGTLAQFSLMPLIAWFLVAVIGMPKAIGVGLILVGCCPGGVSSNIMSYLCKGDVAYSVGMTSLSTLAAPVMTPLLMMFIAGETIEIDAIGMFKSILVVMVAPIAAGFSMNAAFGSRKAYAEIMKVMPGVAVLALAAIVGGVVSAQGDKFASSGVLVFAAVFLHNSLGYALGYLTGLAARFGSAKRRTISIEVGMQNAGLATVLATRHFPLMPEAAVAAAVSCVWHSISGALMAGVFNAADALVRARGDKPRR